MNETSFQGKKICDTGSICAHTYAAGKITATNFAVNFRVDEEPIVKTIDDRVLTN